MLSLPYFLINDGKGNFTKRSGIPALTDSTPSERRAAESHLGDVNGDGWLDLIAGMDGLSYATGRHCQSGGRVGAAFLP